MMIRVALVRVFAGLIGVTAMLAAVYAIPVTLQTGAWIASLGFLTLGFGGLWLISVARSYEFPQRIQADSATALRIPAMHCARCNYGLRVEFELAVPWAQRLDPPKICPGCGLDNPALPVNSIWRSWRGTLLIAAAIVLALVVIIGLGVMAGFGGLLLRD